MGFRAQAGRSFFEWWAGRGPLLRTGIPVVILGISAILLLLFDEFLLLGWILGGVLLLFSGRSDAEKKGYHF